MADYIDRQAAHDMIVRLQRYAWTNPQRTEHRTTVDVDDVNFGLDKIKVDDVAPVVRCKDCKHCQDQNEHLFCSIHCEYTIPEYYCANGAKMDKEEK